MAPEDRQTRSGGQSSFGRAVPLGTRMRRGDGRVAAHAARSRDVAVDAGDRFVLDVNVPPRPRVGIDNIRVSDEK